MNGTIKQKLLLLVGFFIITIVAISAGFLHLVSKGNDFSEQIAHDHINPIITLGRLHTLIHDNRAQIMLALQHDPTNSASGIHNHKIEMHFDKIADNKVKIDQAFQEYLQHDFANDEEKKLFAKLKDSRDDFVNNGLLKVIKEIKEQANYDEGTLILLKEMNPRVIKALDAADELSLFLKTKTNEEILEQKEIYSSTQYMTLGVLTAIIFGSILLSLWIIRSITTPLHEAVHIAKTIASGDLSMEITSRDKNETGQLMEALGVMSISLQKIVRQVVLGADSISTATHEIATGNNDLALRTEKQAMSLQETAASIEELTSAIRINADHTVEANRMILNASKTALEAEISMGKVVEIMQSIDASSLKIVDIISVIDGIAFQTNILALNAAVEAARAGDQGRGFAVVATEVRALAQRSADAAKEIKTLILSSVERVETGIELVNEAGVTMNKVVVSVGQTTQIISEISHACTEQRTGIEHVNNAVIDFEGMTQQNAALVEEASAASTSLDVQTQDLKKIVAVFRLQHA